MPSLYETRHHRLSFERPVAGTGIPCITRPIACSLIVGSGRIVSINCAVIVQVMGVLASVPSAAATSADVGVSDGGSTGVGVRVGSSVGVSVAVAVAVGVELFFIAIAWAERAVRATVRVEKLAPAARPVS